MYVFVPLQVKQSEAKTNLTKAIQENTNRVELLGLMNRERTELARIISNQVRIQEEQKQTESINDVTEMYRKDIEKLSVIVKKQNNELKLLREEIARLKLKELVPSRIDLCGLQKEDIKIQSTKTSISNDEKITEKIVAENVFSEKQKLEILVPKKLL